VEEEGEVQLQGPGRRGDHEATGGIERTFDRARLWLYKYREKKFFVFIHTYEAHAPYTRRTFVEGMDPGAVGEIFTLDTPPKLQSGELSFSDDELRYLRSLYDGGILECDRQIAAFLEYLEEIDLIDKTLVVVTSDHGEELGEQYANYSGAHGHSLHDNQVLVPLILSNPLQDYPVKRIPCQVRLMDTLPTIAEILGVGLGRETDGRSLLPFLEGAERKGRVAFGGGVKTDPDRLFIRWLNYKYVRATGFGLDKPPLLPDPPKVRLHDLEADPLERINLAEERPEILRQMEALEARLDAADGIRQDFTLPDEMDETLRKRLESLGYLR
jgi:arylsulfatase A-like enzyme